MSKFYSKTTNGFYDSSINVIMPHDAIAISDADYAALFAAQSSGQVIQPDANGNPQAINFTRSPDQIRSELIAQAQAALDKSDITILRCYSANVTVPSAWEIYRAALRIIVNGTDTTSTSLPIAPSYPSGT